eukprot:TRINITY_DN1616_c0_g1_i1.p1 TRINITY_DN1616_c0_g1~~TRINITY_DN1616_c0_g1_i1.p1  ORF type:complete len:1120 (-),score=407.57 TRINITY_DN1616_c0_g1_i1:97-3456(-)
MKSIGVVCVAFITFHILLWEAQGGQTAEIETHFVGEGAAVSGSSGSGSGWTLVLLATVAFVGVLVYRRRNDIISSFANKTLAQENEKLKREIEELNSSRQNQTRSEKESKLASENQSLREQLEQSNEALNSLSRALKEKDEQIRASSSSTSTSSSSISDEEIQHLRTLEKENDQLKKAVESNKKEIDSGKKEIESGKKEVLSLRKELEAAKAFALQKDSTDKNWATLEKDKQNLEKNVSSLEKSVATLEKDKQSLEKDKQNLESAKQTLEKEKQGWEKDKLNFENTREKLEKEKRSLEVEKQQLEAGFKSILEQQKNTFVKRTADLEAERDRLSTSETAQRGEIETLRGLIASRSTIHQREIEAQKTENAALTTEIASLKTELAALKNAGEHIHQAQTKQLENLRQQLEAKRHELETHSQQLETKVRLLESHDHDADSLRRQLGETKSELAEAKRELATANEGRTTVEKLQADLSSEADKARQFQHELGALQITLSTVRETLKTKQKEVDDARANIKERDAQWNAVYDAAKQKLESLEKVRAQEYQITMDELVALRQKTASLEAELEVARAQKKEEAPPPFLKKFPEIPTLIKGDSSELLTSNLIESVVMPSEPEVAEDKPEVAEEKPEVAEEKPEVAEKKPEVAEEEDEFDLSAFKKPQYAEKKEEVIETPEVAEVAEIPQENIKGSREQPELAEKLDLPDDITELIKQKDEEKAKPAAEDEEFDLSSFKKVGNRFMSKSRKSKGWDAGQSFEEAKKVLTTEEDENAKFMSLLNTKGSTRRSNTKRSDLSSMFAGAAEADMPASDASSSKVPAFLDIFKKPEESESSDITSPRNAMINWKPWTPGDSLVKEFAVKDDINLKGARRTKKKATYWGGGTGKLEMEDQYFMEFPFGSQDQGLFCVFDGHAGANCAITAKTAFPREFSKNISGNETDVTEAFRTTYVNVDKELINFEYEGCTSTTVFVWQHEGKRYVQAANVGDSTAFLLRANSVLPLSVDHKASSSEERKRIIAMGIEMNENATRVSGLAVSRALGDHFLKMENTGVIGEPYISPSITLEPTDTAIVIASDGLWDVMNGERAQEICNSSDGTASSMARRLLQQALSDPKCTDNITIVVVTL